MTSQNVHQKINIICRIMNLIQPPMELVIGGFLLEDKIVALYRL